MMKNVFCILSFALLFIGLFQFSNREDLQGFRELTGISDLCTSLTVSSSSNFSLFLLGDDQASSMALSSAEADSHSLGILTAISVPRSVTPVKTLKFNDIPTIVQLLSSQDSRLSENQSKILVSDTNYLKYTTKYYIYTLSHIII
ncbi:hypothetical protein [Bacteroides sp.]|uniref:hypothetical protein n=1 Tax=Bacteroides sp. TaxID=29523 RepID=UPI002603E362|nr:hypothetical protein [Bacteroides sp.]MDD3036729.1 hypothetical protein [Bacteroides sp.]